MLEGTQKLLADVQSVVDGLSAVGVFAGTLSTACKDFQAEAVAHGWGGMGARMGAASTELAHAVELVTEAGAASERGCSALGNITDVTPAAHVVSHLGAASTEIGVALTAVQGSLSNIDEAKQAVEEVGQQGLMQAIPNLREQALAVQVQVAASQSAATAELTALQDYIQRSAPEATGGASGTTTAPPAVGSQSTARPGASPPTSTAPTGPRDAALRRRLQPPDSGSHRRRRKIVDATVAYSPKHVGLATGLVGALSSPNKLVASGLVIVGWAYDNVTTYIDRRMKKDDEDNAD
jgi:hypothetical protein